MRTLGVRAALVVTAVGAVLVGSRPAPASALQPYSIQTEMRSPAGNAASVIGADGTAILPDGRYVTPAGRLMTVDLLPLNVLPSRDGVHVYVSSEGMDDQPSRSEHSYQRYFSVIDTAGWTRRRVEDDALNYGMAESPDGALLYVSEGRTGSVGVFATTDFHKVATIPLGANDYPWGMAISPDGAHLYVAGFRSDTLDVVDTRSKTMVGSVPTGEWPYGVTISRDGKRVFVSNWGMYNPQGGDSPAAKLADPPLDVPPAQIGGYDTNRSSSVWSFDTTSSAAPAALWKTSIGQAVDGFKVLSGSLPSAMAISPDGTRLAVTASNDDLVSVLDAGSGAQVRSLTLPVFVDGPTGSMPNGVTWSPDGRRLYVAEAGRNSVAAVDVANGNVVARYPAGWLPTNVAVSASGNDLYVTSGKGLGAGPNGVELGPSHSADKNGTDPPYIDNLLHGTVQDIKLGCAAADALSAVSDTDNGLAAAAPESDGSVIPARFGAGPSSKIKHVVLVLKENRTFDQVFGDLAGAERDQRLNIFGGTVTPNHHALAQQFATGDNNYVITQTSVDGHFMMLSGQVNEFDFKTTPTSYTDNFGSTASIVNTAPENMPLGGMVFNNFYRHNVSYRVYGEALYLVGLQGVSWGVPNPDPSDPRSAAPQAFLQPGNFSASYPTQLSFSPSGVGTTHPQLSAATDEDRAADFSHELSAMQAAGSMPSFQYLILPRDHTDGYAPGQPTPETFMAENDHATGEIVDSLSHSAFWHDTAVFVVEDDTQDGQDHVDSHRVTQITIGPYVRHGYISHVHQSMYSLQKTIDLILGVPPVSSQEVTATSMADYFTATPKLDPYTTRPESVVPATNPPYPPAGNASLQQAAALQATIPPVEDPGPALSRVLELVHTGEAAMGSTNVQPTPNIQQHTLDMTAPAVPAAVAQSRTCTAAVMAAGLSLPFTSPSSGPAAAGLLLLVLGAVAAGVSTVIRLKTRS